MHIHEIVCANKAKREEKEQAKSTERNFVCISKHKKKASTKEESHEKEGKKKMAKRPAKEEVVKFVVGLYTKF